MITAKSSYFFYIVSTVPSGAGHRRDYGVSREALACLIPHHQR